MNDATHLCYRPSEWHGYLWDKFQAASTGFTPVLKAGTDKVGDLFPVFPRELFHRLYAYKERPIPEEDRPPWAGWCAKAHTCAEELPEFARLKARVQGDAAWSGVAAASLASELVTRLPDPPKPVKNIPKLMKQLAGLDEMGLGKSEMAQEIIREIEDGDDILQATMAAMDPSEIRQAFRAAIQDTEQALDTVQNALAGMGIGNEPGCLSSTIGPEAKLALAKRLLGNEKLLRILELCGRKIAAATRKQAQKCQYSRTELVGVHPGDDLAHLLPASLMLLADPETEPLFDLRLLEKSLLCYELQGKERKKKGPIVIALDASGSMGGDKEEWSKAVAMAMVQVAKLQGRTAAVLIFDTRVHKKYVWPKGRSTPEEVMDMIQCFPGGGTSIAAALYECQKVIVDENLPEADVVLISDGLADATRIETYRAKAKEMCVTTFGIGIQTSVALMKRFCDQVFSITNLSTAGPVVENVLFSI